jgi:hypothetical protein
MEQARALGSVSGKGVGFFFAGGPAPLLSALLSTIVLAYSTAVNSTVCRLAMEFREAMDALGLSAPEAAAALGLQPQTVRMMRMDPSAAGYRRPPEGWERVLAKLARERGGELAQLAEQLEAGHS